MPVISCGIYSVVRLWQLKRRGWEILMDHMNDGGFAAIRDAFVAGHGLATIHGAPHRSNLNEMDTLPALHSNLG